MNGSSFSLKMGARIVERCRWSRKSGPASSNLKEVIEGVENAYNTPRPFIVGSILHCKFLVKRIKIPQDHRAYPHFSMRIQRTMQGNENSMSEDSTRSDSIPCSVHPLCQF